MLSQSSKCAVCDQAFLNTWLECVKFVDAQKVTNFTINFDQKICYIQKFCHLFADKYFCCSFVVALQHN